MKRRCRLALRPRIENLDRRCVLATLTPSLLDAAYGVGSVGFKSSTGAAVKGDGSGQTIAIVDAYHDANLGSDLAKFDARYGLPAANFQVIDQAGTASNPTWSAEEALDVEWSHAVAPGAKIVVVEAASQTTRDFLNAINAAKATPGVSVITMSWGGAEFSGEQTLDSTFTTPAGHVGITFLASTGDSGAGAQWPAASPNVVAVGGTSLTVNTAGARVSESAWSNTGGGASKYEPEPAYQESVQSSGHREVADVAAVGDPSTGVLIYSTSAGGWEQVGGTSLSAPVWGAVIAIADEGRALAGKGSLDGATQTLPMLYNAPTGSFYDVASGSRAAKGFDLSTGLGTPNTQTLVPFLTTGTAPPPPTSPSPSTSNPTPTPTPTTTPTPAPAPRPAPVYPTPPWWRFFSGAKPTGPAAAVAGGSTRADFGGSATPIPKR